MVFGLLARPILGFLGKKVFSKGASKAFSGAAAKEVGEKAVKEAGFFKKLGGTITRMGIATGVLMGIVPATAYAYNKLQLEDSIWNAPFTEGLEAILKIKEWSNEQMATAIANTAVAGLVKHEKIPESGEEHERAQKIALIAGYAAIGDVVGAGNAAEVLGLNQAEAVAAYNQAKGDNPDASFEEIALATYDNINKHLEEKKALEAKRQKELDDQTAHLVDQTDNPSPAQAWTSIFNGFSDEQVSNTFNTVAQNSGFFGGLIMRAGLAIASLFGAESAFQKYAIAKADVQIRNQAIAAAAQNGEIVSRMGGGLLAGNAPAINLTQDASNDEQQPTLNTG